MEYALQDVVHVEVEGDKAVGRVIDKDKRSFEGVEFIIYRIDVKHGKINPTFYVGPELWVNGFEMRPYNS